jgi:hypothetical protein
VTLDCVEKLLKKDMLDPINNKLMKDSDIIQLKVWLLQIKLELRFFSFKNFVRSIWQTKKTAGNSRNIKDDKPNSNN